MYARKKGKITCLIKQVLYCENIWSVPGVGMDVVEKINILPLSIIKLRSINMALQKQQLPWRKLYRGGKPPEDGCMKPKHVV
jgi:hypothetical protein